jgi:hypothetical protein
VYKIPFLSDGGSGEAAAAVRAVLKWTHPQTVRWVQTEPGHGPRARTVPRASPGETVFSNGDHFKNVP